MRLAVFGATVLRWFGSVMQARMASAESSAGTFMALYPECCGAIGFP